VPNDNQSCTLSAAAHRPGLKESAVQWMMAYGLGIHVEGDNKKIWSWSYVLVSFTSRFVDRWFVCKRLSKCIFKCAKWSAEVESETLEERC